MGRRRAAISDKKTRALAPASRSSRRLGTDASPAPSEASRFRESHHEIGCPTPSRFSKGGNRCSLRQEKGNKSDRVGVCVPTPRKSRSVGQPSSGVARTISQHPRAAFKLGLSGDFRLRRQRSQNPHSKVAQNATFEWGTLEWGTLRVWSGLAVRLPFTVRNPP